ncbi:lysine biosynthesis enzyme LysX [Sphaerisporangium siamense]|uniref:[lysine-biosynthesis-protein LysW]--L-2-aminoadipate ligase n=1 Tax=Sphaerisporangium siamense TaxID=795645 RepID=A0A7W7D744_9ACTN|nr:lysine biosynthesis protein LysX [Sphaerisporangium siamense]MBB4701442.1 [lysine-biosynthesis-protein LysW]--L-2-aminoadipate ligase [Sphaerisporangium siamense]GII85565.1 lysine biosynthesis enzyme LysX [Sphaerisporangium siamense]
MTSPGTLAVVASRIRADEKRIFDALDRRAAPYVHVDSRTLWSSADLAPLPWDRALNREIGHVRAAYAAHSLEALGTLVVNSARATEVCGDKWRTSMALRSAGLPAPRTALALTPTAALPAIEEIGYPAVLKPLVGSWGRLVTYVPDRRVAETVLEYIAALPSPQSHVVYVQEYVDKPGRDIRALVVGGEVLGAVYRRSEEWRTNVARGAVTEPCEVTDDLAKLVYAAARATEADVAGVDLVEDEDGRLLVLEVNDIVEFSGFQHAMGDRVNVADRIVDHVLNGVHTWRG